MSTDAKVDRLGNFDLCDHGVSLELECEHCTLLPGAKIARRIKSQEMANDPDRVTIDAICGGDLSFHKMRRTDRDDDPGRDAAILVAIGLVCFAVGLLMGSAL